MPVAITVAVLCVPGILYAIFRSRRGTEDDGFDEWLKSRKGIDEKARENWPGGWPLDGPVPGGKEER